MSTDSAKLYQLQSTDIDIDAQQRQIQLIEARIGEAAELRAARERLADAERRRVALELRIRHLEGELDSRGAKITELQKRLFGGGVDKAKQAGAIEKELATLKADRGRLEDQLLDAMSESEDVPRQLEQLRDEVTRIEAAWSEEQAAARVELDVARQALATLEATRRRQMAAVPPALLQKYEELRRTHHGRAVARVERNTCLGCRVALPMGAVQGIRNNPGLSFCGFCGRILHLER